RVGRRNHGGSLACTIADRLGARLLVALVPDGNRRRRPLCERPIRAAHALRHSALPPALDHPGSHRRTWLAGPPLPMLACDCVVHRSPEILAKRTGQNVCRRRPGLGLLHRIRSVSRSPANPRCRVVALCVRTVGVSSKGIWVPPEAALMKPAVTIGI